MSSSRLNMRGFSLIELLLAMVIGLVFMAAVLQVMSNNSRTRNDLELANRRMENGRYALQLLANEIGMAGFYGEQGALRLPDPATDPATDPCPPLEVLEDLTEPTKAAIRELRLPVWGENAVESAPSCGSADLDFLIRDDVPNDYIVIRRASSCAVDDAGCDAFLTGAPHMQIQSCATGVPPPGEPVIASTREAMTAQTRACDPDSPAPIYRLFVRLFYIAANHQPSDGIPTLKMAELGDNGYSVTALAEGIEAMQIEYVDDAGETYSAADVTAAVVTDWDRIRGVKLYLLARNTRPLAGPARSMTYRLGSEELEFHDSLRRQVLSSTVRLHNLSLTN